MIPQQPPRELKPSSHGQNQTRMGSRHLSSKSSETAPEVGGNFFEFSPPSSSSMMKRPTSGAHSPSFHTSQTVGQGRARMLLCVDNEDSNLGSDIPDLIEETASLFSLSAEENRVESPTQTKTRVKTPTKEKIKQRMTHLKKVMPQYRIDKDIKKKIITTMVDMNYWSEPSDAEGDDSDDDANSPQKRRHKGKDDHKAKTSATNKTQTPDTPNLSDKSTPVMTPHPPSQPASGTPKEPVVQKPVKIYQPAAPQEQPAPPVVAHKKVIILDPKAARGNQPTVASANSPAVVDAKDATAAKHSINDLAQPAQVRPKVTLIKPKQIQIPEQTQMKMNQLDKVSQDERKTIREHIVTKAVQILMKLENDKLNKQDSNAQKDIKEKNERRNNLAKRFSYNMVEKAMKHIKNQTYEKLERKKEQAIAKFQKKIRSGYKIYKKWQKSRIRRYCYVLLAVGKQMKKDKEEKEEKEQLAYRLRMAKRMIYEYGELQDWKDDKKDEIKRQIKELKVQKEKQEKEKLHHGVPMLPLPVQQHRPSTTLSPRLFDKEFKAMGSPRIKEQEVSSSSSSARPLLSHRKLKHSDLSNEKENSSIGDNEGLRVPETTTTNERPALTAEEELLSDDPKYTRPDLAPFSTRINEMIRKSMLGDGEVAATKPRPVESVIFGEIPFTSILSAKFMYPAAGRSKESRSKDSKPHTTSASASSTRPISPNKQASFNRYPTTPAAPSLTNPSNSFNYNPPGKISHQNSALRSSMEFSMKMSVSEVVENAAAEYRASYGTISTPYQSPRVMKWDGEPGEANTTALSMQAMRIADKKFKSPAFKALEKFAQLTEADIRSIRKEVQQRDIVNEIIKHRKSKHQSSDLMS